MTTLIISDLHLGSRNCQSDLILRALQTNFDRLILNGDTINNLNLKKLQPDHWRVIDQLRQVARKRELVLIRGNHDGKPHLAEGFGPLDVLGSLLGAPMQEEFLLDSGSRRYLVLHGDRFDPTLNWPVLSDAADWGYHAVQKVNKKAAKWLKKRVKKLGGVVEFVKKRSMEHAQSVGCQGIITGHTHFCDDEWIDDLHYLNTGSWVERPCTYVVAERDQARLCFWDGSTIQLDLGAA